ncbi:DUF835 domain-containing protein [Thermococcus sp. 9N3]|uniref:DUF835 domain-containing protein n=1 Tax=Thermococcus sp. 9N3 TaxID=163002 RepID=UPI001431DFEF|nr:DUF835 domain-containing protein [Thermococcus sp. 9N3]NJE49118.1 DUF835 domain-containing protein [Thermococcus sp. 9N3]
MDMGALLGVIMAGLSFTISALLFIRCRSSGRFYAFAAVGWGFFGVHAILRTIGVPVPLREILTYFFALFVSLYVILNVLAFHPEKARMLWMYTLIPTSHIFYRLLSYAGVKLPAKIGGLAGDSGVMLLITAYISYVAFRRAILSLPLIPMGVVLFFYKILQGTPLGFSLMAIGTVVFAVATIRVMSLRLFKGSGSEVHIGDSERLVLVESSRLGEVLRKYREYPILLITRRVEDYPEIWTVFYLTAVDAPNSVQPTSLERLRHFIVRYLNEARLAGSKGVVVIDGFEYLRLYNDTKTLLKFLADLRDHAIANGGVVFVGVSKDSWEDKEFTMLSKMTDGYAS